MQRLEAVCQSLDISFIELFRHAKSQEGQGQSELSLDQERELAADKMLFVCFYLLLNAWTPGKIARKYHISKT